MVETEDDLSKIRQEDMNRLLHMKNLHVSDSHEDNLNTLREFCCLDYGSDHVKPSQNPFYQPLANYLLVECFKRRVAATNEDSQRLPKDYFNLYRYACEWRYGTALREVFID